MVARKTFEQGTIGECAVTNHQNRWVNIEISHTHTTEHIVIDHYYLRSYTKRCGYAVIVIEFISEHTLIPSVCSEYSASLVDLNDISTTVDVTQW